MFAGSQSKNHSEQCRSYALNSNKDQEDINNDMHHWDKGKLAKQKQQGRRPPSQYNPPIMINVQTHRGHQGGVWSFVFFLLFFPRSGRYHLDIIITTTTTIIIIIMQ